MNHEKETPTIQAEANRLRAVLTAPDSRDEAHVYFETMSQEMIEAVSVVDTTRAIYSCELLLRNLVNACNNAGTRAIEMMSDAHKEVIDNGAAITGINFRGLEETTERQLESLQIALNGGIELHVDYDPANLKALMDALLWVNESLFNRYPEQRSELTQFTDLGYYIDNLAAARLELQPKV